FSMLPDSQSSSSSQSRSRHTKLYKGRGAREDHNVRRREVTVEIRKKKRDDMLLERRTRNFDPSSLNVEKELGSEAIERLMSPSPALITEGLILTVDKMRSSLFPLGMALASSGVMSKIVKSYSKNERLVLVILRNLNMAGPNFIDSSDHTAAFSSLVALMKDSKWVQSLDQLLFASCVIYEKEKGVRNSQDASDLAEILMNLLPNVDNTDMVLLRNTVWMASLLIRGTSTEAYTVPLLSLLLDKSSIRDFDVLKDSCVAFSESASNTENEEFVLDEMIPTLVSLISSSPTHLLSPIVQSIVALFEESRDFIDKFLECDLLDSIGVILNHNETCADACWILGVILDPPSRRKIVATNEALLSQIVAIVGKGTYDQRKECVEVVHRLMALYTHKSDLRLLGLSDISPFLRPFSHLCIPPLCDLLTVMDALLVQTVLETLLIILNQDIDKGVRDAATKIEECDGISKLEFLQNSRTIEVSMLASEIVNLYFDRDQEDSDDVHSTVIDVVNQICNVQPFHF
ncbi:hypothetical protein PENTCL1PPCAC_2440, partial [Pristionchus entomophagus]